MTQIRKETFVGFCAVLILGGGCVLGPLLSGCRGDHETFTTVIVEPGDVVEIADEHEMNVLVSVPDPDHPGSFKKVPSRRKLAGGVWLPKSVYLKLRAKAFPEIPEGQSLPLDSSRASADEEGPK